jgi:DNA-directed RNA polymerase subunit RPC12/RpoP
MNKHLEKGQTSMKKCSTCSKEFPEPTLKKMVQIIDRKAYLNYICPACQSVMLNNPNYYYLTEEKPKKK